METRPNERKFIFRSRIVIVLFSAISESVLKGMVLALFRAQITLLRNIPAGLDGGKLTAATYMPLQAWFLDKMIDNNTELIALNSNDDDIFCLISLRRNHKDHVPPSPAFSSTFSFDIIFVCPGQQQTGPDPA